VNPDICPLMPTYTVHDAWVHARQVLRDALGSITFDQLVQKGGTLPPNN
jgi:hypothetical protein